MTTHTNMFASLDGLEDDDFDNITPDPTVAKKKRKRKKKKKTPATTTMDHGATKEPTKEVVASAPVVALAIAVTKEEPENTDEAPVNTPQNEQDAVDDHASKPSSAPEQAVATPEIPVPQTREQALEARLVRAAEHPQMKDCLVALDQWFAMETISAEDVKLFFMSRAILRLLENFLLQNKPVLLNSLHDLLSNALAKAAHCTNKSQTSMACRAFVSRIRKMMGHLDFLMNSCSLKFSDMSDLEPVAGGLAESIKAFLGYLEKFSVIQKEAQASELEGENTAVVCRKLKQLEDDLAKAQRCPPSDIGGLFHQRDLCLERVRVLKNALIAQEKKTDGDSSAEGHSTPIMSSKEVQSFIDVASSGIDLEGISNLMSGGKVDLNPDATKGKAKKMQGEIEMLQKERDESMRPLEDEQQKQTNLKDELSEKRAGLVKQLEEVDSELKDLKDDQESIHKEVETVQKRYISAVKRTPNYEDGLLDLVQQMERREALCQDMETLAVRMFEDSEKGFSNDMQSKLEEEKRHEEHNNTAIGGEAQVDASELINPNNIVMYAKAYLLREVKCMPFIKTRMTSGNRQINKLSLELENYQMLNMNTMVRGTQRKLDSLKEDLEEDENTLALLNKSSQETYSVLRHILDQHGDSLTDGVQKEIPQMRYFCHQIGVGLDWKGEVAAHEESAPQQPKVAKEVTSSAHEATAKKPPVKKAAAFAWGAVAKKVTESSDVDTTKKTSKMSIFDIQREELENRLTKENLERLEMGKRPARSPLLDKLRTMKGNAN